MLPALHSLIVVGNRPRFEMTACAPGRCHHDATISTPGLVLVRAECSDRVRGCVQCCSHFDRAADVDAETDNATR